MNSISLQTLAAHRISTCVSLGCSAKLYGKTVSESQEDPGTCWDICVISQSVRPGGRWSTCDEDLSPSTDRLFIRGQEHGKNKIARDFFPSQWMICLFICFKQTLVGPLPGTWHFPPAPDSVPSTALPLPRSSAPPRFRAHRCVASALSAHVAVEVFLVDKWLGGF